jgi:hypothetical protein
MPEFELGTIRRIYCNTCKGETKHELKALHERCNELVQSADERDEHTGFEECWEYRLWICRGCDTATLEEAYTHTGMLDPRARHQVWKSTFHPRRKRRSRPFKRFYRLDDKLTSIYREVIESFNTELGILCAVGLRALLEGICADKEVKGSNLYEKIEGLKAHLPSNIVQSLHSFRFMGNEAAHELQAPYRTDLQLAIEVMEDLLNFLYELNYKAQRLPKGT